MKKIALLALVFAAFALQACAPKSQEDCGFVQNVYGERISWADSGQPVTMFIHKSVPQQYVPAIRAAAETWNKAAGKVIVEISDQIQSGEPVAKDRINIISWSTTWDQKNLSEQAKTSIHWVGDQIQEADIKVNASTVMGSPVHAFYWGTNSVNGVNIEALILHELGHVLGLKHQDAQASVMATYLSNNSDRTKLSDSDVASLRCEYN